MPCRDKDGSEGGGGGDESGSEVVGAGWLSRCVGGSERERRRRRREKADPGSSLAKERFERHGDGFGRGAPVGKGRGRGGRMREDVRFLGDADLRK